MKKIVFITALLFWAILTAVTAKAAKQNKFKSDTLSCLEVDGRISNPEDGTSEGCLVELITNNEVINSIVLKEGKKKFKFLLNKNTYYAIRVSKKGYITKIVSVNTEIVTESFGLHSFLFETSLLPETVAKNLNQEIIDFPVAIIHYDYEEESFSYSKEYTAYIKKELRKANPVRSHQSHNTQYRPVLDVTDLACN